MKKMDDERLLLIDDDAKFGRLLAGYLQRFGYSVEIALDGVRGLDRARGGQYAAIILDVMLPGMTGWDVLRNLRTNSQVPVLMLTALGDEADRISGLEIGADDYVPKTFSMRELLARLRAVLRRSAVLVKAQDESDSEPLIIGALRIDTGVHEATLGGSNLQLTAGEFALLLALARAHPRVKTRDELLLAVGDRDLEAFDRSVDVRIATLRRKLGDDARAPRLIETIRGVGYRLRVPGADSGE
jgi:DNA-binding response OmpR family regulator